MYIRCLVKETPPIRRISKPPQLIPLPNLLCPQVSHDPQACTKTTIYPYHIISDAKGRVSSTQYILSLLKVLSQLNSAKTRSLAVKEINAAEFVSTKLTAKLTRQLQDALTLVTGALPAWCHTLTSGYPFLFPFECRRLYLSSTAFGVARALKNIKISLHGQEMPTSRIERRKVPFPFSFPFQSGLCRFH